MIGIQRLHNRREYSHTALSTARSTSFTTWSAKATATWSTTTGRLSDHTRRLFLRFLIVGITAPAIAAEVITPPQDAATLHVVMDGGKP